nr:methylated-DNA--[protein]-cysteine S-methyltransferase [Kofleriaceae bacterium]
MKSITVTCPFGTLVVVEDRDEIVHLALPDRGQRSGTRDDRGQRSGTRDDRAAPAADPVAKPTGVLRDAARQLADYFAGTRRDFDLPLAPRGTGFQQIVWRGLLAIPFGETCSYGELAAAIGRPAASRAVGAANGANPIAIIIPCHRVIGSDRTLTGYGGGLPVKKWLLAHEGLRVDGPATPSRRSKATTSRSDAQLALLP